MTNMAAALPIDLGNGPFAVTTRRLAKRFGSTRALDGLDLQVPEGAVYVLVGPNGACSSFWHWRTGRRCSCWTSRPTAWITWCATRP